MLGVLAFSSLWSDESHLIERGQLSYLMQNLTVSESLSLYEKFYQQQQRHDRKVLETFALKILREGIRSSNPEVQLMSLYGCHIGGIPASLDILEAGIKSQNPHVQLASIQFLSHLYDTHSYDLLVKAMSSPFLPIRIEAGLHLAEQKHPKASALIESLMKRLPEEYSVYFPQFFALIATPDSIGVLKQLIEHKFSVTRVEAILAAAKFGLDDLLPKIRAHASHSHPDEQEAAATALGIFQDSHSLKRLETLSASSTITVKIAALKSLIRLGDQTALDQLSELALKTENLFAIASLAEFKGAIPVLKQLLHSPSPQTKANTALSLLRLRERESLPILLEFLTQDDQDLTFLPTLSLGHTLVAWKLTHSSPLKYKEVWNDIQHITTSFRQSILTEALELPEDDFLTLAKGIFASNRLELIPLTVSLLCNHQSEKAIELLKENEQRAGSPLVRAYSSLGLYRIQHQESEAEKLRSYLKKAQKGSCFQFRPPSLHDYFSLGQKYELTPEENSQLLIETYSTLAEKQDEKSLNLLLESLKEGNPANRYLLAGLLIKAIQ